MIIFFKTIYNHINDHQLHLISLFNWAANSSSKEEAKWCPSLLNATPYHGLRFIVHKLSLFLGVFAPNQTGPYLHLTSPTKILQ
jgi:hypothetical protein